MSDLMPLCALGDILKCSPLRVEPEHGPALVVFHVQDRYFVARDKCTHGAGVLSEGDQDGALIECPLHRGVFDVTSGKAVRFPCLVPLRVIEAVEQEGWLCVPKSVAL